MLWLDIFKKNLIIFKTKLKKKNEDSLGWKDKLPYSSGTLNYFA